MANICAGDDNQSQDEDQGLTAVGRAIEERRTLTRNLEQQLKGIARQLRELMRGGVQVNINNLLNQAE